MAKRKQAAVKAAKKKLSPAGVKKKKVIKPKKVTKRKKADLPGLKLTSGKSEFPVTNTSTEKTAKRSSNSVKKDSEKLSEAIVAGMKEKKATEIVVIDLRRIKNAIADFFIVCSGTSDKHIEAITDSIDEEVSKTLGEDPWHSEGKHNKEWMLLDYITVVAHIFKKERRQFYALEKLWGDADIVEIED
jgi:ribosome-associated protein